MQPEVPDDIRDEVRWMREALRAAVRESPLSYAQVAERLGLYEGYLNVLFAGKVELRVAHVFGILRAIGMEPWHFFLKLQQDLRLARLLEGPG